LVEEGVNGCKHGAYDKELQRKKRRLVEQEDQNAELSTAAVLRALAADHVDEVCEHFRSAEHRAVHPASALLH